MSEQILSVDNLKKHFTTPQGTVKAVDGVTFSVNKGETFGLVGESGSGKSTTGYVIIGIYSPSHGSIYFKNKKIATNLKKRPKSLKKEIQIVFQDPGSSLNPRRTIREIIEHPLKVHGFPREVRHERVLELLEMVELPEEYLERYPVEIGGGEKQMVAIARALGTNPSLIILDEPTSALDVSMQSKILEMLNRFQNDLNLPYVFITHNLSVMRNVASRIAIMYLGKINEVAHAPSFFTNPLHPYTRMLLSSIPVITKEEEELKPKKIKSVGEIPSPVNVPAGCGFHPRCPKRMSVCDKKDPTMRECEEGHFVRCHLYDS